MNRVLNRITAVVAPPTVKPPTHYDCETIEMMLSRVGIHWEFFIRAFGDAQTEGTLIVGSTEYARLFPRHDHDANSIKLELQSIAYDDLTQTHPDKSGREQIWAEFWRLVNEEKQRKGK